MNSEVSAESGDITWVQDGALARVTLRHPGKFNAMSRGMWRQLQALFAQLHGDARVRCVLLQGAGGHFCAGGDIAQYPAFRFQQESLRAFHEDEVWGGLQAMLDCDVPIVAAIAGNCMGAGVEIASCCDLRLAAQGARFGAPIARLGFPMAPREAALVAGAVGPSVARAMLLAARVFDAASLLQSGFLLQLAPEDQLLDQAEALALSVTLLAPQAARLNKQLFRVLNGLQSRVEYDSDAIEKIVDKAYDYADSAEHREGIAAFLAKRPARF